MPDAGLKCDSVYSDLSLYTVPAELSFCLTIQMTQEQYAQLRDNVTIIGCPNGTSWFALLLDSYSLSKGFIWSYKNANLPEETAYSGKRGYYRDVMSAILDGKPHKLVCCIGDRIKEAYTELSGYSDKGLKFFLDGVAVNDGIGGRNKQFLNVPTEFNATNKFRIGTATTYTLTGGVLSNIKYFNFDISADGSAYTLDDYQNDKDIPDGTSGVILNLANKLSGNTWQDESGNGYDMALQGDFEIVDI